MSEKLVRVVVACHNASGEPDFTFYQLRCTQAQYDNGDHYDEAKDLAAGDGYESPMVCYDENDGPKWLFDRFNWTKTVVLDVDN